MVTFNGKGNGKAHRPLSKQSSSEWDSALLGAFGTNVPYSYTCMILSRVILSFLIAGTWISAATFVGEKLGSRIGGFIASLPSNIMVSFLFIALTKGPLFTAEAAISVPLGMSISITFVVVFSALLTFGIYPAIVGSLTLWFVLAYFGSTLSLTPIGNLILYTIVGIVAFLCMEYLLAIASVPKRSTQFSILSQILRALFAGSVVAGAVWIAQISSPNVTGIAASFPAVMLSTLTILYCTQGKEFARATAKIMVLSSSNIIIYAYAAGFLYPRLGILFGTLFAFLAAVGWAALLYPISKKLK